MYWFLIAVWLWILVGALVSLVTYNTHPKIETTWDLVYAVIVGPPALIAVFLLLPFIILNFVAKEIKEK